MGFLDFARKILPETPQQPSDADVLNADQELADFKGEQRALAQQATIAESIERRVREEMERVNTATPKARNLAPFDAQNMIAPEAQGDAYPVSTGTGLSYRTLNGMAKVPVIANIIETRVYQAAGFARRQRYKDEFGFKVVMRDHNRAPSTAALKRIAEIEAWYESCGDPTQQEDPSFETFVSKLIRDSLIYDQGCAEILLDKYRRPAAMIPVDAKTIRRAQVTGQEIEKLQRSLRKSYYIQTLGDARVHAQWDQEHFMFGVRRPRTEIEAHGYGYPELEQLARIVTYILQAEYYNASNFTNGVHAAGLVIVKSAMDRNQFAMLDKKLRQTLAGAHNAHRMAFMQIEPGKDEDVKALPFSANNKDMEFSLWVSWLLKIACGLFAMDPAELNFVYGNENQRSALNQQDPAERIAASRERGLLPILRALENWLNRHITWRLDEDFKLEFAGLSAKSPLVQSQLNTQSLGWKAPNEIRAREDEPPLDHWVYNHPANPVTLTVIAQERQRAEDRQLAAQQQAAAAQQQGQPGQPAAQPAAPEGELPDQLPAEFQPAQAESGTDLGQLYADLGGAEGDIDFEAIEDPRRNALPPGVRPEDLVKSRLARRSLSVSVEA